MSRRTSEEVYASPVISGPQQDGLAPPLGGDGRARRTRGSSSDEDATMEELISEDFRVGGPNLPPLPCDTISMPRDHPAYKLWSSDRSFPRQILDVLKKNDVDVKFLELFQRKSERPYISNNAVPTVIATSKRSKLDSSWLKACMEIRHIFKERQVDDLNIEIIDSRATKAADPFTFPVLQTDPIFNRWSEVCTRIMDVIGREGWLSLECFRRGLSDQRQENPVTIILTIPYDSDKEWKPAREGIVHILDTLSLSEVAVSIIRGHIWRAGDPTSVVLTDNSWEKTAQCGMSLGPADSDLSSSTFGGFIELMSPEDQWVRFGLTCYRSVVEEKDETSMPQHEKKCRERWSRNGIPPSGPDKNALKMSQPSLKDHRNRMKIVDANINEFNANSGLKDIKQKIDNEEFVIPREQRWFDRHTAALDAELKLKNRAERFFSSGDNYFGTVFAASGFGKATNNPPSQLDWALIEVEPSRSGPNRIPPSGTVSSGFYTFTDDRLQSPPEKALHADEILYKLGRTTGFTAGRYDGLRSIQLHTYQKDSSGNKIMEETYEHTIVGEPGKLFSDRGDSGAIIFDITCGSIGLLFGGNADTKASYFTPFPQLFEDVKRITGAKKIRILSD
ncbi:hypothetical protein FQN54_004365 [Arachnomyces sp. PD_36]|nr:hypothetical protein FQN54_004365 [Arachnomyces sp. PD_36]